MAKFVQYSEVEMIIGYAETSGRQTQQDKTNYCPILLPSLCYSCYIRVTKVFYELPDRLYLSALSQLPIVCHCKDDAVFLPGHYG